jgi:hypothetical protein
MRMSFRRILLLIFFFIPLFSAAQDTAKYKPQVNYKQEIVIGDKRYRVWDNWVNFGVGGLYHSSNPRTQLDLDLEFNFHITKVYFNLGGYVSGDYLGGWTNYQLHLGYIPWRRNNEKWHLAVVGAISYSRFYSFVYAGHYYSIAGNEAGLYAEVQAIRKIEYTTGIGAAFFVDVNPKFTVIGLRVNGYLSGAYRGYVKGKEPKTK